jgi:hypothetical protein
MWWIVKYSLINLIAQVFKVTYSNTMKYSNQNFILVPGQKVSVGRVTVVRLICKVPDSILVP